VRRSVRGVLGGAAWLYAAYPWLFLILALAVMAPCDLGVLATTGYGPLSHAHRGFGTWLFLTLLRSLLIGPLISALHIHAVVAIGSGERPRLATVARRGLQALPVVGATEVVANVGTDIGFLLLIVPGVVLALMWSVAAQAAALEGRGWLGALGSSRDLTNRHYGHVLGVTVVTAVIAGGFALGARALPLGATTGAASVALGVAVDTATASFAALTLALLYFDLKVRKALPARTTEEYQHLRDLD
jgi:hypothetical protein